MHCGDTISDPLSISLIREMVFSCCTVETLKLCRLVSKTWYQDSLKAWRANAMLRLTGSSYTVKLANKSLTMREYLHRFAFVDYEDPLQLKKYPFKNFCFVAIRKDDFLDVPMKPISDNARLVKFNRIFYLDFISNFKSLQSLEFDCSTWVIPPTKKHFRELKSLQVKKIPESMTRKRWNSLLECIPNLQNLSVNVKEESNRRKETICKELFEIVKDMNKQERKCVALKELELSGLSKSHETNEDLFNTIAECQLPLEKLTIEVTSYDKKLNRHPLHYLMDSCKDTLNTLRISCFCQQKTVESDNDDNPKTVTVKMMQLKYVVIMDGLPHALQFLTTLELPTLKKLTVEHAYQKTQDEKLTQDLFPIAKSPFQNLRTFEFIHDHWTPDPDTMRDFVRLMPNLKELVIPLDAMTFPIVCQGFPLLTKLHILNSKSHNQLDDFSLTGVTVGNEGCSRPPNISDLELLTHLTISCDSQLQRDGVKFTAISIMHGIRHLPRLTYLSIAFKQITDFAKAVLLSHVGGYVHFQEKS